MIRNNLQSSNAVLIYYMLLVLLASSLAQDIGVYWGQNSEEGSLGETCATGKYSYVNIAFLKLYFSYITPNIDLRGHCESFPCTSVGSDIKYCQKQGVKVMLSIKKVAGIGDENLSKLPKDRLAMILWNQYLGGNSSHRPLGDAILDGIDFATYDNDLHWKNTAEALHKLPSKQKIYLSAAPLCSFHNFLNSTLNSGILDYLWIQFLGSPQCQCNLGNVDNLIHYWKLWTNNLRVGKILLGLPASPDAASGYVTAHLLNSKILPTIRQTPNFGGIMLWNRHFDKLSGYSDSITRGQEDTHDKTRKQSAEIVWISTTAGALAITSICYLSYAMCKKYKAEVKMKRKQEKLMDDIGGNTMGTIVNSRARKIKRKANTNVEIFSFESMVAATNNFSASSKLGEGGFGPVYKGRVTDNQEIAIKRLSRSSGQGLIEFKNEAKLISRLQHTNLVRLLGLCIEREERILVYEYMSNRSLDVHLFDAARKGVLDWEKRHNIIEGIAQAILYLHKYSREQVIHRDLKASNILLDDKMNPKVSDFGMARIVGLRGFEEKTNRIVGTHGYMSPEYILNGIISIKTDVFSFGVLVLEIISGKKNSCCYHSDLPLNLTGYAWKLWNEGRALELMDQGLNETCNPNEVLRYMHIGLLCVQHHAEDRPTMFEVISFLSNHTMQLAQPKQPAFFIDVDSYKSKLPGNKQECYSINYVTLSAIHGR